jgi:TM2 domain-containing membrane protein YozV
MRITAIDNTLITITDDTGVQIPLTISHFNFTPEIGDEVNVCHNEGLILVSKAEENEEKTELTMGMIAVLNRLSEAKAREEASRPPEPEVIAIRKSRYILLGLFFGCFGIHRFYAKQAISGVYMLILQISLIFLAIGGMGEPLLLRGLLFFEGVLLIWAAADVIKMIFTKSVDGMIEL